MTAKSSLGKVDLMVLNGMAGTDLAAAFARQRAWGLSQCDLKDQVLGKRIEDLATAEAREVAALARTHGLGFACLSSSIGNRDPGEGEATFRAAFVPALERLCATSRILQPRLVRLIWPQAPLRDEQGGAVAWLDRHHPWLIPLLREAVAAIAATGAQPVFENECGACIVRSPGDAVDLITAVGGGARLIWDVQNLWQTSGRLPRLEDYPLLRPHLASIHLKGGRRGTDGERLAYATSLAAADWPIVPILRAAVADRAITCICLNPSHGQPHPDPALRQDYAADLAFVRHAIPETSP